MIKKIAGSQRAYALTLMAAVFVLMGLLGSCGGGQDKGQNNGQNDGQEQRSSGGQTESTTTIRQYIGITKLDNDSLIEATVKAGSIPDSIVLQLDHDFQRANLVIQNVQDVDSLVATLHASGSQRNLRFNQIVMPDGTMDGPFGHELHYRTGQNGTYTLKIGKDNMADGTVKGPAVIYIHLR